MPAQKDDAGGFGPAVAELQTKTPPPARRGARDIGENTEIESKKGV
jgi:hypothetical protein